ncbi:hypothetical protein [uncultured Bacteroides sp.]|uniref:hypothetical protein n=1 Tax=uncultured Bacteroides sp. TaxID=162156 RepID=UPI002AA88949|nr:hypothetical protein [uncultured Bacteroides sp.]
MKVIWHLRIQHEFFKNNTCRGIEINILPETVVLLNRKGWIIRPIGWGEWDLITFSGMEPDEKDTISLEITVADSFLNCITDWQDCKPECSYSLELNGREETILFPPIMANNNIKKVRPGIICRINFTPGKQSSYAEELYNDILLRASKLYWEYIFLFRNGKTERNLLLVDTTQHILFGKIETTTFLGKTALSCRSVEKIPLREEPISQLCLQEICTSGKKELFNRLPLPEPGIFVDACEDTIKQIIYI